MSARIRELSSACAALVVVAAYVLPASLDLVADASHGLHHAVEEVREHRRLAESLGLVHLPQDRARRSAPATVDGGFTHSHGGSTHAHDAATDALLRVTAQSDDNDDHGHVPSIQLATHLPVTVVRDRPVDADGTDTRWDPAPSHGRPDAAPLPPPPRA